MSGVKVWRCPKCGRGFDGPCDCGGAHNEAKSGTRMRYTFYRAEPGRWYPETEAAALEASEKSLKAIVRAINARPERLREIAQEAIDALEAARRAS